MATQIPKGFVAPVSLVNVTDAQGNPTVVDSITSVTVSDETKCEVVDVGGVPHVGPILDPAVNSVGDAQQVIVTADVRLGPDVVEKQFIGTFDVPVGDAALADVGLGPLVAHP